MEYNIPKRKHSYIRQSSGDRILIGVFYAMIAAFSFVCLMPILLAFSVAFSNETSVAINGFTLIPQKPTLDTFIYILGQRGNLMLNAYVNSLITTFFGTIAACAVTTGYAYAISVPRFKNGNKLAFFAYFTMLFSGGMLPWYIICTKYYHLSNTYLGLILPDAMSVFNMYLMRNYFKTIPIELHESAKIDGAGHFMLFFRIMLPLSKAGISTIALFYGLGYWNDFYLPLMLATKDQMFTVQFLLYRMMSAITYLATANKSGVGANVHPPLLTARMAMTVIAIGPIILVYPFIQKYFVKGVIVGAIKG